MVVLGLCQINIRENVENRKDPRCDCTEDVPQDEREIEHEQIKFPPVRHIPGESEHLARRQIAPVIEEVRDHVILIRLDDPRNNKEEHPEYDIHVAKQQSLHHAPVIFRTEPRRDRSLLAPDPCAVEPARATEQKRIQHEDRQKDPEQPAPDHKRRKREAGIDIVIVFQVAIDSVSVGKVSGRKSDKQRHSHRRPVILAQQRLCPLFYFDPVNSVRHDCTSIC